MYDTSFNIEFVKLERKEKNKREREKVSEK